MQNDIHWKDCVFYNVKRKVTTQYFSSMSLSRTTLMAKQQIRNNIENQIHLVKTITVFFFLILASFSCFDNITLMQSFSCSQTDVEYLSSYIPRGIFINRLPIFQPLERMFVWVCSFAFKRNCLFFLTNFICQFLHELDISFTSLKKKKKA